MDLLLLQVVLEQGHHPSLSQGQATEQFYQTPHQWHHLLLFQVVYIGQDHEQGQEDCALLNGKILISINRIIKRCMTDDMVVPRRFSNAHIQSGPEKLVP